MVDIQSATAENRREKKKTEEERKNNLRHKNIMSTSAICRAAIITVT